MNPECKEKYTGKYFQVDIISVNDKDYQISCFYFSFGDIGSIIGGILKHWGVSLGGNGLIYNVCHVFGDFSTKLRKIIITKDIKEILFIAGLSDSILEKWLSPATGGESDITERDLFDWVTTSRLFHAEFWNARSQKWNIACRERIKLRPMYQRFLFAYIPEKFGYMPVLNYVQGQERIDFVPKDVQAKFTKDLIERYNLTKTVADIILEKKKSDLIKEHFNGKLVGEILGIKGKEIEYAIKTLKKNLPDTLGNPEWVLNSSIEEVSDIIKSFSFE